MSLPVSGPDYDDDEPETFRPVPHPDDRLWRHPSEIAAQAAANANADTVRVPAIHIEERKNRFHAGLLVAAGVVVVGAAALTLGVVSTRGSSSTSELVSLAPLAVQAQPFETAPARPLASNPNTVISAEATAEGDRRLAARIHTQVAPSLPRVQAATPSGMREGSGFFVTSDGHIATSAGLIEDADYVLVWTQDGQRWKAQVIANDRVSDVAVIHIDTSSWPSVSLASNADLRNGQYALALDHERARISVGEVTAIEGSSIHVAIPAAVAGSAVVDDTGDVIAMITSEGATRQGTPAWMIEQVAIDLISAGATTHTWLGVIIETGSGDNDEIVVLDVLPGSPAAHAGLRPGDLIDSVNGSPTPSASSLHRQVEMLEPGDAAVLTVTRNGSRRIVIATLAALPTS